MTSHIEADPGIDTAHASTGVVRYPVIFAVLFAPFGISSGYVQVTLAFLLGRAGLPTAVIGGLIALSIFPQTWKVLWAPLIVILSLAFLRLSKSTLLVLQFKHKAGEGRRH